MAKKSSSNVAQIQKKSGNLTFGSLTFFLLKIMHFKVRKIMSIYPHKITLINLFNIECRGYFYYLCNK